MPSQVGAVPKARACPEADLGLLRHGPGVANAGRPLRATVAAQWAVLTGRRDSWVLLQPAPDSAIPGAVWDVRSGARGSGRDGRPFAEW